MIYTNQELKETNNTIVAETAQRGWYTKWAPNNQIYTESLQILSEDKIVNKYEARNLYLQ